MDRLSQDTEKPRDYDALQIPLTIVVFILWALFLNEGCQYIEGFCPLLLTLVCVVFLSLLSRLPSSAFRDAPYWLPLALVGAWVIQSFVLGSTSTVPTLVLALAGWPLFWGLTAASFPENDGRRMWGHEAHQGCLVFALLGPFGVGALPAAYWASHRALDVPDFGAKGLAALALICFTVSVWLTQREKPRTKIYGIFSVFALLYLTSLALLVWPYLKSVS